MIICDINNMEEVVFTDYKGEEELQYIINLMKDELSEPYPVYTYRYFVNNWPKLAILV